MKDNTKVFFTIAGLSALAIGVVYLNGWEFSKFTIPGLIAWLIA